MNYVGIQIWGFTQGNLVLKFEYLNLVLKFEYLLYEFSTQI